jgi:hypothetical protein
VACNDRPTEYTEGDSHKEDLKELKEREAIEENNMVRYSGRKKLMQKSNRLTSGLSELTAIAGGRALANASKDVSGARSMREQMDDVRQQRKKRKR